MTVFACEADKESGEEYGGEVQCQAAPTCDFNQVEVERCDPAEDNCEVVSMCGETVFCLESGLLCNDIWDGCQPGFVQVEMCDEFDESCVTQSVCGAGTIFYCELEATCGEIPECGDNQEQVDSCEEGDESCEELRLCGTTIYCQEREEACLPVAPTCEDREEISDVPCQDNGEACREVRADCSVAYCRPIMGEAVLQCEPENMLFTDPFEIEEATIEYDTLWLKTLHSGNCEMHIYDGCFSEFAESSPVQVTIYISHNANGDECESSIGRDQPFDLSSIKQAYQDGYGVEGGTIMINIEGTESLEYTF